jgi:hypothetical protein
MLRAGNNVSTTMTTQQRKHTTEMSNEQKEEWNRRQCHVPMIHKMYIQ